MPTDLAMPLRDCFSKRLRDPRLLLDHEPQAEHASDTIREHPKVSAAQIALITVRSNNPQKLSELHIDLNRYVRFYDDAGTTYYASRDDGVKYEVSQEGTITGVSYIASNSDNYLRCLGFPPEDATTARYKHFDEYSKKGVMDETARLDNFAVELQNNQSFRGYVISYAGRHARAGEAQENASEIKSYLVKKRGIESSRVVAIDGGHREQSTIELYLVPRDLPPPVPSPTIGTKEVRIIKTRNDRTAVRPRK